LVLRIARLAEAVPEIAELDLNPVIALSPGNGCRVVDTRIRVAAQGVGPAPVRSKPQVESSTTPETPPVVV
jgi:ATP-grasp domain